MTQGPRVLFLPFSVALTSCVFSGCSDGVPQGGTEQQDQSPSQSASGGDTAIDEPVDATTGGGPGGVDAATGGTASTDGAGGMGDGVGTGGDTGTGGSVTGAPTYPDFELLWDDAFDELDTERWNTGWGTFEGNGGWFHPHNVTTEGGILRLHVTEEATVEAEIQRDFRAGSLESKDTFLFGRYETRARFAAGSGLVSAFFTFHDDLDLWNEIDIEYRGRADLNQHIQFNVIHYPGHQSHEELSHEAVDLSADFHVYAFEWLPTEVRFYVDGELRHTEESAVIEDYLKHPSNIMLSLWPVDDDNPGIVGWAGAVDGEAIPAVAEYDWVRVYSYTGAMP